MTRRSAILISAEELAELLRRERDLPADASRTRVLDVRWSLPQPDGRPFFEAGHIPGAVYVDLDHELARHGEPRDGRHPLPSRDDLEAAARRWGIREGDSVVVHDGGGNLAAARAWWLLRNAGLDHVRLLDGALPAWERAGFELETGSREVSPGDVSLGEGSLPVLELADIEGFVADGGALLDARAGERYRGEQEPIDPLAGHIPGALSTPTIENLDADGRFLPEEELRERFAAVIPDRSASFGSASSGSTSSGSASGSRVATYCGSGVTAAHNLVALALAGIDAALYPGSWSQWSNHPELPVATGE